MIWRKKKPHHPWPAEDAGRCLCALAIFLFCQISCKQVRVTLSLEVVRDCRDLRDGRDYAWRGEQSQRGWEGHGIALLSTWSSTLHYLLKLYFLQLNLMQVRDMVGLWQRLKKAWRAVWDDMKKAARTQDKHKVCTLNKTGHVLQSYSHTARHSLHLHTQALSAPLSAQDSKAVPRGGPWLVSSKTLWTGAGSAWANAVALIWFPVQPWLKQHCGELLGNGQFGLVKLMAPEGNVARVLGNRVD